MFKRLILALPPQKGLLAGFPQGVISLANYISMHNKKVSVEIWNLSLSSPEKITKEVDKYIHPEESILLGISTTTASYQSALSLGRACKERSKRCSVILGGHHASGDSETILRSHPDVVDFIIRGEGEKSLLKFINSFPAVDAVPGLAYINNDCYIEIPPLPFLTSCELDNISLAYKGEKFISVPGKFNHVTYVSARGCPKNCSFCAAGNEEVRIKSLKCVKEDIRSLVDEGYQKISIEDNFFAHSRERTIGLCEVFKSLLDQGAKFSWDCQTRVESLTDAGLIRMFDQSGCEAVYVGVESFCEKSLFYLNKTSDPKRYVKIFFDQVLRLLLRTNIECYVNLQFGIPAGNGAQFKKNLTALEKAGQMAMEKGKQLTVFPMLHVLYPATALFEKGLNRGEFPVDVFENFTLWEAECKELDYFRTWLSELFAHGFGGLPVGILDRELLSKGEFDIKEESVQEISQQLSEIRKLPGIKVFDYVSHVY